MYLCLKELFETDLGLNNLKRLICHKNQTTKPIFSPNIIIIIIIIFWGFFTLELADCFSLECKWQQVSSSLQDPSQYPGRFEQFCRLNGLYSSSYFQVLQSLYQSFGDCTKSTNLLLVLLPLSCSFFFQSPSKVQVLICLFAFFQFYLVECRDSKIHYSAGHFFFLFFFFCWSSGRN